jgi:hypothetical protein
LSLTFEKESWLAYRTFLLNRIRKKLKETFSNNHEEQEEPELEFDDIDSESEIEIDESEEYPEEW